MTDDGRRLNLVLTPESGARLDAVRAALDATSDSEAIRRAIRFFDMVSRFCDSSGAITIQMPNGETKTVVP